MKNQQLKDSYYELRDTRPSSISIRFVTIPIYLFSLTCGVLLLLLGGAQLLNDYLFLAAQDIIQSNNIPLNMSQSEQLIGYANTFSIVCICIGLTLLVLVFLTGAIHRRNRYISRQEEVIENLLYEHRITESVAAELKESLRSIRSIR